MTKTEIKTIENIIRRLKGERCSEQVKDALTGPARIYLESWVIPALEMLLPGEGHHPVLAEELSRL